MADAEVCGSDKTTGGESLGYATGRVFHEHIESSEMTILASQALLRENKKIQRQNVTPLSIELTTSTIQV